MSKARKITGGTENPFDDPAPTIQLDLAVGALLQKCEEQNKRIAELETLVEVRRRAGAESALRWAWKQNENMIAILTLDEWLRCGFSDLQITGNTPEKNT